MAGQRCVSGDEMKTTKTTNWHEVRITIQYVTILARVISPILRIKDSHKSINFVLETIGQIGASIVNLYFTDLHLITEKPRGRSSSVVADGADKGSRKFDQAQDH